jgi:tripeptidyl-peptidase-1
VAAIGDFVVVYVGGVRGRIGGTSASSPTFAAIITRVNEERLAVGKGPVGFINPVLVSYLKSLQYNSTRAFVLNQWLWSLI